MCDCFTEVMMYNVRNTWFPGGTSVMDYLCISPADSSQFSISAGGGGKGLEGRQSIHSVLLQMRLPIIRSILSDTSADSCPPDSIILANSDWKDVANMKSLPYYHK